MSMNASGKCLILVLLLSLNTVLRSDTLKVFGPAEYFSAVRNYHPVSVQAALRAEQGKAMLLKSRGAFDPKLSSDFNGKFYDNTNYYEFFTAELSVPTWYGLELKSGYERNRGAYVGPENNLPGSGLIYAGISANIGNGLFIDERRAALRNAKVFRDLTLAEQRVMMNELVYEAGKAYWDWFAAYNAMQVYENALVLASQRMEAVRQFASLGDRPWVDTLEAGIQLQERMLSVQQARLDYANRTLRLAVFLWTDDEQPYELPAWVVPPAMENIQPDQAIYGKLLAVLDTAMSAHPALQAYAFKLESLSIDREWKREQLKPTLKLNYFPLFESGASGLNGTVTDNYKWGMTFSMPVFLRKERGDLKLTELYIRDIELERKNKSLDLLNKTRAWMNEFVTTTGQIGLYSGTVREYEALLNAERRIFEAGESSLFMINARELGFISARLRLIDLISKNNKALLSAVWSAGLAHLTSL